MKEERHTVDDNSIRAALRQLERDLQVKQRELEQTSVWQEMVKLQAGVKALRSILGDEVATEERSPQRPPSLTVAPDPIGTAVAVATDPEGPRGREAIRILLAENVGEWVSIGWLADEMVARGWVDSDRPREAVRTSADRLVKTDDLVEKGRAKYRLVPDRDADVFDGDPLDEELPDDDEDVFPESAKGGEPRRVVRRPR